MCCNHGLCKLSIPFAPLLSSLVSAATSKSRRPFTKSRPVPLSVNALRRQPGMQKANQAFLTIQSIPYRYKTLCWLSAQSPSSSQQVLKTKRATCPGHIVTPGGRFGIPRSSGNRNEISPHLCAFVCMYLYPRTTVKGYLFRCAVHIHHKVVR